MEDASLAKVSYGLDSVKKYLITSQNIQELLINNGFRCKAVPACFDGEAIASGSPSHVEWRILDHCSAITRIYALFEAFIHESLAEYILYLNKRYLFSELPEKMVKSYRLGLSRLIEHVDKPRYANLSLPILITNYQRALEDNENFELEPRALLYHEQNLRLEEINQLLSACGLDGFSQWLNGHALIRAFFAFDRLRSAADAELRLLIDYRNDAAHGGLEVDDILGVDELSEFAEFVETFCAIVHEFLLKNYIEHQIECEDAYIGGTVTELYRGGRVIVSPVFGQYATDDEIILKTKGSCKRAKILNIQLDDEDTEHVSTDEITELGFLIDVVGQKGAEIIIDKGRSN